MSRAPLYQLISDDIAAQISAGELTVGTRLPSEHLLAEQYSVSRMTVRQALDALTHQGLLVRRRGAGNFVAEAPHGGRLEAVGDAIVPGATPRLIEESRIALPDDVSAALGVAPGTAGLRLLRNFSRDERTVAVQEAWVSASVAPGLSLRSMEKGAEDDLHLVLETRFGVRVRRADLLVRAERGSAPAAGLGLEPDEPVLRVARTCFDERNLAVEFTAAWIVAGEPVQSMQAGA